MPVVFTDHTNKTWCTEQLTDGFLHVGYTGQAGPRLIDLLDFASTRQRQFEKFVAKRRVEEHKKPNGTNKKGKLVIKSRTVRN